MNNKNSNFEFRLKTRLKFGTGEALNLGKYLKEAGFKRIGVIADPGVFNLDYFKKIIQGIEDQELDRVKVWEYDIKGEPDYDSLDRVKAEFLDENQQPAVDCFVSIGGGSVMDFAKGLAVLVVNPGKAINYRGFPKNINSPLPNIALPTTAGTASEVTYFAVFINHPDKTKRGINTTDNFPVLAILDPKLTLSCPKVVIASSGIDALSHALESYVARQANSLTKVFAKEGFKLLFNNLFKVLDDPENLEIRSNLQLGAYLAGISLMNSGAGPAGDLSYPLCVHFGAPHGLGTAVFFPYIIEHNVKNGYDHSELYDLIEGADKSLGKEEKNRLFSEKTFELSRKLGVPSSLRGFGVNEENIGILLKEVEKLAEDFKQNPVPFSVEQGKELLKKLIS